MEKALTPQIKVYIDLAIQPQNVEQHEGTLCAPGDSYIYFAAVISARIYLACATGPIVMYA